MGSKDAGDVSTLRSPVEPKVQRGADHCGAHVLFVQRDHAPLVQRTRPY